MAVSKPLFEGVRYSICAWLDEEERSATHEFITELSENNDPDAGAMIHLLDQTASHGPPHNPQKFRYLKGKGQGLVEFKARGGSRILAFIDTNRKRIICTHGIPKLKTKRFDREVTKAQDIKELYMFENAEENGYVN
jgi:Phage derived protein Gp49-like (DUF891)